MGKCLGNREGANLTAAHIDGNGFRQWPLNNENFTEDLIAGVDLQGF